VLSKVRIAFVSVAATFALSGLALAQDLTVAAASDLQSALPAVTAQFEKDTGHHVSLTFGSSGNFLTQIENGAPFDVFLSADIDYPRQLERSGKGERGTLYAYATGRLVLWTRNDSGIDLHRGLVVLTEGRVKRVAIANPEHAPYGRAAMAALRHEEVYNRVIEKLVIGENIAQTAQFVQFGTADVGIIALSLALSPALQKDGTYVEIPETAHPPIEQAAIAIAASHQLALARQFIDYLKRPETGRLLQSLGFAAAPIR
jgi:molybdate transport system substrate-binding protein